MINAGYIFGANTPPLPGAATVTGANNGLSLDAADAVLGQDVGAPGDPAALLSSRYVPMGAFFIRLFNLLDSITFTQGKITLIDANNVAGDNVFDVQSSLNGFRRIRVLNTNSGATAGAGSLYTNDVGRSLQFFMGSSTGQFVADGVVFRTTGFGGMNIVSDNGPIAFGRSPFIGLSEYARFIAGGNFGLGLQTPTAVLHIKAGAVGAGTAPYKYSSGVAAQTVLENGAKNYDGSNEYLTAGGINYTIAKTLTATGVLAFPLTAAQTSSDLTIAVTGAADGDVVSVGVPIAALLPDSCYTAFVSAAGVVTVRFNNYAAGAQTPAAGTFRVSLVKY